MKIGLHTVFIANENVKWLDEYIQYHVFIGVTHFFLYDNTGSVGRNGSTTENNKYGFKIEDLDQDLLTCILEKYKDIVTYIKWQPKIGPNIVYGQVDSIYDCMSKYRESVDWMCFVDLDEFIVVNDSLEKDSLQLFLSTLEPHIGGLKMTQKKFVDRFLTKEKLVTQEFACINGLDTRYWAPKYIIRSRDFRSLKDIHNFNIRNKMLRPYEKTLRFNHYNLNDTLIKWYYKTYKRTIGVNGFDETLKKFSEIFK
jgi:hypothetical protein